MKHNSTTPSQHFGVTALLLAFAASGTKKFYTVEIVKP